MNFPKQQSPIEGSSIFLLKDRHVEFQIRNPSPELCRPPDSRPQDSRPPNSRPPDSRPPDTGMWLVLWMCTQIVQIAQIDMCSSFFCTECVHRCTSMHIGMPTDGVFSNNFPIQQMHTCDKRIANRIIRSPRRGLLSISISRLAPAAHRRATPLNKGP